MQEVLKEIYESYKNRVTNPLVGNFILAWIIFNWKAISIFFLSDDPITDRIRQIYVSHSSSWSTWIGPLLIGLAYVWFLPLIMMGVENLASKFDFENKRKDRKKDERLNDLRRENDIVEQEIKLKISRDQNISIDHLNTELTTAKEAISGLEEWKTKVQLLYKAFVDINIRFDTKNFEKKDPIRYEGLKELEDYEDFESAIEHVLYEGGLINDLFLSNLGLYDSLVMGVSLDQGDINEGKYFYYMYVNEKLKEMMEISNEDHKITIEI